MKRIYGLIGNPLVHSFSKTFFEKKFENEIIKNSEYHLFEIKSIDELRQLINDHPDLVGLNVTIPFKEKVFSSLDKIHPVAQKIGAINTIKIVNGLLTGYNTDYLAFQISLLPFIEVHKISKALILGTGGASRAVQYSLANLKIDFEVISRRSGSGLIGYERLFSEPGIITECQLLVNTTPVGMFPSINQSPPINYDLICKNHMVYDLIYNPSKTKLLEISESNGAAIKNGIEMLELQAEESWKIWNE